MSSQNPFVSFARKILPESTRRKLTAFQKKHGLHRHRIGRVDMGQLRTLKPISSIFGMERGMPIDRYYIEAFLRQNASDFQGRGLELGDAFYLTKFGGDRVTQKDVLHYVEGNPEATFVGDLTDASHIPSDAFDCIVLTQTLQMIYNPKAALETIHRILKPGGVLLLTTAGIAKVARRLGEDDWGEYWHLTSQSVDRLIDETFPGGGRTVSTWGNVVAACAFLHGLASEDLDTDELDHIDPDYEVIVTVRAVKAASQSN